MKTIVAIILAIGFVNIDAIPYSKYGRTCKDIGCRSTEECVMVEDPCTNYGPRDKCGRYPTCQRRGGGGGAESCMSKICPTGQYCRTINDRATCVDTVPHSGSRGQNPSNYNRVTPRPVVPTPPPRSSSFNNRFSGSTGNRTNNSLWNRLFNHGSDGRVTIPTRRPSGYYPMPTPRPSRYHPTPMPSRYYPTPKPSSSRLYPGGNTHYNTHTSTDKHGNRVWTFSG